MKNDLKREAMVIKAADTIKATAYTSYRGFITKLEGKGFNSVKEVINALIAYNDTAEIVKRVHIINRDRLIGDGRAVVYEIHGKSFKRID